MTARSRERGSHAGRPRGHIVPFPPLGPGTQTPVRPVGGDGVADPVLPRLPDAPEGPGGPVPPGGPSVQQPSPNAAPPSRPSRSGGSRHRKQAAAQGLAAPASRRWRPCSRSSSSRSASASPTASAARRRPSLPCRRSCSTGSRAGTRRRPRSPTAGPGRSATELAAAYTDVDATNAFFALKSVVAARVHRGGRPSRPPWTWRSPGSSGPTPGDSWLTSTGGQWIIRLDALAHQPQPRRRATGWRR